MTDRTKSLSGQLYWGVAFLMLTVLPLFVLDQARLYSVFEKRLGAEKRLIAEDLASAIERQSAVGLLPEASSRTVDILTRSMSRYEGIKGIAIVSDSNSVPDIQAGEVDPELISMTMQARVSSQRTLFDNEATGAVARIIATHDLRPSWLILSFSLESAKEKT